MTSPARSHYSVTGSLETHDMTAHVIVDAKNRSIHIHFYSEMFGNQRRPILVKHANRKFPEKQGVDLVKQVILKELPRKNVQIGNITAIKERVSTDGQTHHPKRVIIRFKK